jgi:predicted DNA binding CopG/RHH family protein
MKYYELNKEEKEIKKSFDEGKLKSVGKLKSEKKKYQQYARATLSKAKNVNIRLSEKDLQKIKAKAAKKGIPYQTLMSSLLHQHINDEICANC